MILWKNETKHALCVFLVIAVLLECSCKHVILIATCVNHGLIQKDEKE